MTARKECKGIAALLPAYANGTLNPDRMRLVADHLWHCPACRKQLHEWQLIGAAANAAATGPLPSADVISRVLASIDASHDSPQRSHHKLWHRMSGGHRRLWPRLLPGADGAHGQFPQPNHPFSSRRSAVVELRVIAILILVLSGGVLGYAWTNDFFGQDSTGTQGEPTAQLAAQSVPTAQPTASREPNVPATAQSEPTVPATVEVEPTEQATVQRPAAGQILFSSVLSNVESHPAANLRLGRLAIEPGSGTVLESEESSVILLVEVGIVSGLVNGPAIVNHGGESGQTQDLDAGEDFQLQSGDQIFIPIGTSSELLNNGDETVQALDIRIQRPGPPLEFANDVQYQQFSQAAAKDLPIGEVDFSLVDGNLSAGDEHEIEGPAVFYVESGTVEVVETNTDLEVEINDNLNDRDSNDPVDPDEQIVDGGWFFLKAGERALLTVPDGQATYIELLFEPEA